MLIPKIKGVIRKLLIRLCLLKSSAPKDYYISKVYQNAPWVYIAYIPEVFVHLDDENFLSLHQNLREAIAMVDVFNELGFNVFVQNYNVQDVKIENVPQIVFGLEPNIVSASLKFPNAWKIYYATGAYGEHQNAQVKFMTDYVNKKYRSQIPYRRLVDNSILDAYKLADNILLIGSKYTINTFPPEYHKIITTIHQSTQLQVSNCFIEYSRKNEFLFMASSGNLLKGFSLLVEYVSKYKDIVLNVVGPIEEDVMEVFRHKINMNNIILHGWVDVNSKKMIEIVERCNFIIYPSGSEGMPGAVLNLMKCGLIPIVSKWAAFDEIEDYGYVMDEWSVQSIHEGVLWSQTMDEETITQYKRKCSQYVSRLYNLPQFKKELAAFVKDHYIGGA